MQEVLILVAIYVGLGILSALVAERSRIDAWAEQQPRLAAVLKIIRGLGLDPWMLVAAVRLLLSKRLPLAQREGSLSLDPPATAAKPKPLPREDP